MCMMFQVLSDTVHKGFAYYGDVSTIGCFDLLNARHPEEYIRRRKLNFEPVRTKSSLQVCLAFSSQAICAPLISRERLPRVSSGVGRQSYACWKQPLSISSQIIMELSKYRRTSTYLLSEHFSQDPLELLRTAIVPWWVVSKPHC